MNPSSKIREHWLAHARTISVAVFLMAVVCSAVLIGYSENRNIEVERCRVAVLAGHAREIQREIEHALSATETLAVLVRHDNGVIKDFSKVAQQMLPLYPGVVALQLAPGGVIRQIVPLLGNEKALGHNLLQDPLRTKEAFLALDTGKLTLAGTFELLQGGQAMAGRLPVFLSDASGEPVFWGFVIALIRVQDIFKTSQLEQLVIQGLDFQLSRRHPDTREKQITAASSLKSLTIETSTIHDITTA